MKKYLTKMASGEHRYAIEQLFDAASKAKPVSSKCVEMARVEHKVLAEVECIRRYNAKDLELLGEIIEDVSNGRIKNAKSKCKSVKKQFNHQVEGYLKIHYKEKLREMNEVEDAHLIKWRRTIQTDNDALRTKESFEIKLKTQQLLSMGYDEEHVKSVMRKQGKADDTDLNELIDEVEKLMVKKATVSGAPGSTENKGGSNISHGEIPERKTSATDTSSIKVEHNQINDKLLCKICMDRDVEITFTPCGHLDTCEQCGGSMSKCPICRQLIKSNVKTYMS